MSVATLTTFVNQRGTDYLTYDPVFVLGTDAIAYTTTGTGTGGIWLPRFHPRAWAEGDRIENEEDELLVLLRMLSG